jgi:hypothetical protein
MAQLDIDFGDEVKQATPNNVRSSPTQEIASNWVRYAHTNKLNPKTKKYREAQHAYLCGIGVAMKESMPMLLSMCLASGRDIASIIERTQPR